MSVLVKKQNDSNKILSNDFTVSIYFPKYDNINSTVPNKYITFIDNLFGIKPKSGQQVD